MMSDFLTLAFIVLLFVALTPGIYFTYPNNGNKFMDALFHGIAFALILYFTHSLVRSLVRKVKEGFKNANSKAVVTTSAEASTIANDSTMPVGSQYNDATSDDTATPVIATPTAIAAPAAPAAPTAPAAIATPAIIAAVAATTDSSATQ
jgi:hypothetical protein